MVEPAMESKVAKYIIKNAPYGEEKFVLDDLSKLLQNTQVSDEDYIQTLQENYHEHLAIFHDAEKGKKVITSKYNQEENYYVNQQAGEKYTVNYLEKKIKEVEPYSDPISGGLKELREEIDKQVQTYIKVFYRDEESMHLVHAVDRDEDFLITVLLTGKFLNLNNLYTGQWASEWLINKDQIEGRVRVDAHYFEDGNIQLKEATEFKTAYEFKQDQPANAKKIVEFIRASEDKVIAGFEQVYEIMTENAFKYMRKPLPITKAKMDWTISTQKVIGTLKGKI